MPLIAVEGADAVGKSTQVKLLADFLAERAVRSGVSLRGMHLPRLEGGRFSLLLQKFLKGEFASGGNVDPQLVALLFACDRFDVRPRLEEWLGQGDIVLMDRYVASNVAYQCAKLADGLAQRKLRGWIEELEYGAFGLPHADVTLCFDAPLSFSLAQIAVRRNHGVCTDDVHEMDVELQRGVRRMYGEIAESDPNFYVVRCGEEGAGDMYTMRDPEEIFEEVRLVVDGLTA